MKKIATLLTFIATLAIAVMSYAAPVVTTPVVATGSSGTAAPDNLPLSLNAARAYAWEQTKFIQASAWSQSTIQTKDSTNGVYIPYEKTNGFVNSRDVLKAIAKIRLQLCNLYTNSSVSFNVTTCDKDGYPLLNGYAFGRTSHASPNGISTNVFPIELRLNDVLWLTVTNVSYAYVVQRDQYGNPTNYVEAPINQYANGVGKMPYYLFFAGKDGELMLTMNDGMQSAYSLTTGKKIKPNTSVITVAAVTAPGYYYAENTNQVWIEVTDQEYEQKLSPLLEYVNTTGTNINAFFGADLPTGEQDAMVRVWKQGTQPSDADWFKPVPESPWALKMIPPGYWWVEFKFTSGFGEDQPFYQPYNYGGGGKG